MNTFEKLTNIFRTVFDDSTIQLQPEMTSNDIDAWDSLSHVTLLLAIEADFGISFSQKDARRMKNVGELIRIIENKLEQGTQKI